MTNATLNEKIYSVEFISTESNVIQTSGLKEIKIFVKISEEDPYVKIGSIKSGNILTTIPVVAGLYVKLESQKAFSYDKVGGTPESEPLLNISDVLQLVSEEIAKVVSNAPESFDTLKEIAEWIESHSTDALDMQSKINSNEDNITELKNRVDTLVIPSVEGFATELWVENKNYLTEHQDLSDYALKSEIPTIPSHDQYALKEEIPSVEGLISESFLESKGYLTQHQDLSEYAKKLEIPTVTGLATEAWVEGKGYLTSHLDLSNYALKSEIPLYDEYALKTEIPSLDGYALSSDIPSVDGLASETSVDAVSEKTDSNTLFLKKLVSELSGRIALIEAKLNATVSQAVVSKASEITAISAPAETSLVVSSDEAIQAMTANVVYKDIAVVGADTEVTVNLKATDSIIIEGSSINGNKDAGNGKVNFSTPTLTVKNVVINGGSTAYNVFEGELSTETGARNTEALTLDNVTVETPTLTHNVANVYTPTAGAVITIKNSYFNLNVAKSNVLRISNYLNSDNVIINLENIDWTYENKPYSDGDIPWAGLILFQPAGADVALGGDTSHIATWTINIKNCRYNGVKVTESGFGKISSIGYTYNIGGTKKSEGINKYITVNIQ